MTSLRRHNMGLKMVAGLACLAVVIPAQAQEAESKRPEAHNEAQRTAANFDSLLTEALNGARKGARGAMAGKQLRAVNLKDLVKEVLEGNRSIRISDKDRDKAFAAKSIAAAAFDPSVSASWSWTRTETFERADNVLRLVGSKELVFNQAEDDATNSTMSIGCIIDEEGNVLSGSLNTGNITMDCGVDTLTYDYVYTAASYNNTKKGSMAPWSWTGSLGFSKPFDWGASFSANISSTRRIKNSFQINPYDYVALSYADPFGWGDRMPWTTNASFSFGMPLPYMKNFGQDGSSQVLGYRVAESAERKSLSQKKSIANSVLEQVVTSYWSLVQSIEQIETLASHLLSMEERLNRTKSRFDNGLATAYDVEQLEVEVENLRAKQEQVWGTYHSASIKIADLIAVDSNTLFKPADFESLLERIAADEGNKEYSLGLDGNPDIKASMETLDMAKSNLVYRENQVLPDFYLSLSANFTQVDTVYGYGEWERSMAHVFDPDKRDLSVSLRYRLPFWRDGDEARLSQARIDVKKASDNLEVTRNRVINRIDSAVAEASSNSSLVRQTKLDLDLAAVAYQKALSLSEAGHVSEFELLRKYDDLLNAKLAHIDAKVSQRKANVKLLSAQGVLDEKLTN